VSTARQAGLRLTCPALLVMLVSVFDSHGSARGGADRAARADIHDALGPTRLGILKAALIEQYQLKF